jgi:hypothetical protein
MKLNKRQWIEFTMDEVKALLSAVDMLEQDYADTQNSETKAMLRAAKRAGKKLAEYREKRS